MHEDAGFDALARDLTVRTGVSLEAYKPKCLRRRIAVRMRACGVHTYDEYRGVLANTPEEVEKLHDALTINVTRFFRNPETWEAVRAGVLPGLLAKHAPVRAWSAGCSSGEEAHTLAMLWADAAERAGHPEWLDRFSVEATDIDRACMLRARAGRYRTDAFVETPPRLMERWTRPEDAGRIVDPRLRVDHPRRGMEARPGRDPRSGAVSGMSGGVERSSATGRTIAAGWNARLFRVMVSFLSVGAAEATRVNWRFCAASRALPR